MKLPRRSFLHLAAGGAATLPAVTRIAWAQTYPARPVRLIVTFAPGGGLDVITRLLARWLSERTGQQFFVENRAGGGGIVGIEAVVNAAPDGYTLLMVSSANATNAALYGNTNVDLARDIVPVGAIVRVPNVMEVNLSVPAKTVAEFVAYAKANPGKVNMASAGLGTTGHMNGELFKMMTGVNMLHAPYRGGGPALTGLMGGEVQVLFDPIASSKEHIKSGKVRGLAVTSAARSVALPDIPTVSEAVPGYEANFWVGVGAAKGMPAELTGVLNNEINFVLADPKLKERFAELGGSTIGGSPAEFGNLIVAETEKWTKVIKFAGIKAE
jgi:tripartite-type tricarboxylate transporter receptor subunit TctC